MKKIRNYSHHFFSPMEYFIVNESNNYYLDVEVGSLDKSAKIIVTPAHYNPSQRWRIQGNSIISANSNYVIDICHGEKKDRQIIQYKWHNGSNQKWNFYEDGTIRSEHGLCLKANYDNKVVSSEYTGYLNQK